MEPSCPSRHPRPRRSIPRQNPLDQFLHRGGVVVRIERVLLEAVGRVTGKGEVFVRVAAMRDVLQRFLDAEAAWIGQAASGVGFAIHPAGKGALAEATPAIGLILADFRFFFFGHEHQRIVWRFQGGGEASAKPDG